MIDARKITSDDQTMCIYGSAIGNFTCICEKNHWKYVETNGGHIRTRIQAYTYWLGTGNNQLNDALRPNPVRYGL